MPDFLIDENLPARLAEQLTSRGHPSQRVADIEGLRAAPDDEVVAHAASNGLILVTMDKELAFVTRFPRALPDGLVSVRIRNRVPIDDVIRIVVSALLSIDPGEFAGSIVVVEPGRVRIRRP